MVIVCCVCNKIVKKVINNDIEKENRKMEKLKMRKEIVFSDELFDTHVKKAAQVFTEENMKELILEKEDSVMKLLIVRMMLMKQIQSTHLENRIFGKTLAKLEERRKIISTALKQQQQVGDEKKRLAKKELDRQKKLMQEREHGETIEPEHQQVSFGNERLDTDNEFRQFQQEREELSLNIMKEERAKQQEKLKRKHAQMLFFENNSESTTEVSAKMKMMKANKHLVDQSNKRIFRKMEEIERKRHQIMKAQIKNFTEHNTKEIKTDSGSKQILDTETTKSKEEIEEIDFQRNAEILQKNYLAIAAKYKTEGMTEDRINLDNVDIDDGLKDSDQRIQTILASTDDEYLLYDDSDFEDDIVYDTYDYGYEYQYDYDETLNISAEPKTGIERRDMSYQVLNDNTDTNELRSNNQGKNNLSRVADIDKNRYK